MKILLLSFVILAFLPLNSMAGNCDYSWQTDSAGRSCGGRAANVRPGGKLGGDGRYRDSYQRQRIYGPNNDIYDDGMDEGLYDDMDEGLYEY